MSQLTEAPGQLKKPSAGTIVGTLRPLYTNVNHNDSGASRVAARGFLRLARSRYNMSQDLTRDSWTRLRCSPYQAKILRVEHYLVDENGRSIMSHIPENITTLRSSRPCSSRKPLSHMASPHTPRKQPDVVSGSQFSGATGATGVKNCVSSSGVALEVPMPPPKDTPRPKKHSPLDKDLPAKPALRNTESPQRRGILDATDSAAKRMTVSYPPLKPSNIINHRSPMSDSGSVNAAPALGSLRGCVKDEVGTTAKKAQKVRDLPITTISQRGLRQSTSNYSLVVNSRGSATTHRAANLGHGHIGAYKNGSPIQRYSSIHRHSSIKTPVKINRRSTRSFQVLQDNPPGEDITVKVNEKQTEEGINSNKENVNALGAVLTEESVDESPVRSDIDRRYVKLGVGPTVRYSKDAREVLMGKSPNVRKPTKKAPSVGAGKLLNDGPYPRLPEKSTKDVTSRFQIGADSASRLNRPTFSSAARTQDSKAKIESRKSFAQPEIKNVPEVKKPGKGIRSRVSDLLHGRRRSAQPVDKTLRTTAPDKKDYIYNKLASEATAGAAQIEKLTAHREQGKGPTNRQETDQAHGITNAHRSPAHASPSTGQPGPENDNGPSAPSTNQTKHLREHCLQNAAAMQTEDARLEAAIAGVQACLDDIIATTQGVEYPGFRAVVEPVIRSLAASIISAQNARVAVVGLGNATQRVVTDTLLMNEAISRAAVQAQAMVGDIQNMVGDTGASEAA